MPTMINVTCPKCQQVFIKSVKLVNRAIKRSGQWQCKPCANTDRNKSRAVPVGTLRPHKTTGYVDIKTADGWMRHHRYVMEQHLGRKLLAGEVVHHINENKSDNRIENLAVMKHSDHTVSHHTGQKMTGAARMRIRENKPSRLNMDSARQIRASHASGVSQRSLARQFNVAPITVNRIVNNKSWKEQLWQA